MTYYQRAIDKDPGYALAYVGIADLYFTLIMWGYIPPKDAYEKARMAAEKALEIDLMLAESHTALSTMFWFDFDLPGIERELKRAIELNPNYALAHQWYSMALSAMERFDEAITEAKRMHELDPFMSIGTSFMFARRYDEAIEQLLNTIEINPNFHLYFLFLGMAYIGQMKYTDAITAFQKLVTLSGGSSYALGYLGSAYGLSGQNNEALQILNQLNELSKERYVSPFYNSLIYTGLCDNDQAFEHLEKAFIEREGWLPFIKVLPVFDSIRSDPRYKALLKKAGFPED